ncbi:methyl-accepting chemotaxis protein [Oceaniglobus roseus]|uniref:methyl-accepting chemotaxis protein n=1 Tax=Oceaniglobus roseus TaxID=1737570 RepID=UPI000C7F2393|nr:methyl-accepting chemotaxis protein [Kandeliimicrobium roseum]
MTSTDKLRLGGSIAFKFAIAVILSIAAVVFIMAYLHGRDFDKFTVEAVSSDARVQGRMMSELLPAPVAFDKGDAVQELVDQYVTASNGNFTDVLILNAEGQPVVRRGDGADALIDFGRTAIGAQGAVIDDDQRLVAYPLTYGADRVVGSMTTRWSTARLQDFSTDLEMRALAIAAIVALIALAATFLAFRALVLKPLAALTGNVDALRRREYDTAIAGQARGDEFGVLSRSVDHLREDLAAAAVAGREARFKSEAFKNSSAAMVLADEAGEIFAVNPSFEALCNKHVDEFRKRFPGFDAAALVGKPLSYFHPRSNRMLDLTRDGVSSTIAMGDTRLALNIQSIEDAEGHQIGCVLEWQDISEQWKDIALIDAINVTQLRAEFTPDGRLTAANDIFARTIGTGEGGGRGMTLRSLSPGDCDAIIAQLAENSAFVGEMRMRSVTGADLTLEGSVTSVQGTDGKPYRLFLLGRDVTETKAEAERIRAERDESDRERADVVAALQVGLKRLSDGDLRAVLPTPFAARYEELREDYNRAVERLCEALSGIAERAETIRSESQDISGTAETLSRRTESTAATLEQAAAALDALTGAVRGAAESAQKADTMVTEAKSNAEASGQVVLKTVSAMDEIATSSEKVASIIKVIDDIAFQTNLLALNAGVEAARAGEAGRGFAVVASEVRALAQRSSEAAREINGLIAASGAQVKVGVDLVGETGQALRRIVASVSEISGQVSEIAGSAKQQALTLEEINSSVNQLDQSTQQNAARLEETTAASDALRSEAVSLVETIGHFRLSEKVVQMPTKKPRQAAPSRPSRPASDTAREGSEGNIGVATGTWTDF